MSARALRIAGALALLLSAAPLDGGAAPALDAARQLFAQNRWAEARQRALARWEGLAPQERAVAQFLIGRAYTREAELVRWVRAFANEVGRDYLAELAKDEASRDVPWLPLFRGLYALSAGDDRAAERALAAAAAQGDLPEAWRARARLRRAVALHRLGDPAGTKALEGDRSPEAAWWRGVLLDRREAPAPLTESAGTEERLWAAALLLRAGQPKAADALLDGVNPDRAVLEYRPDANKVLRFYDPAVLEAYERVLREQAVRWLAPLAASGGGAHAALAAWYAGANLHRLGRPQAQALLESAARPDAPARGRASILLASTAAASPPERWAGLWRESAGDPESVLLFAELARDGRAEHEPFASLLPARMAELGPALVAASDRATTGRWGLVRLRAGADPGELVSLLGRARDNANKNRIEANDPLLLLAIAQASYRHADYAQSLETLYAVSEAFPGLRGLHWNLQGTYAARQKAGGEARISQ